MKLTADRRARPTPPWPWVSLITLSLLGLGLSGCSHVIAYTTEYYKDGPTQLEGPQGVLDEGTLVLVIGREGSYMRVWTGGFIDAYVRDNALRSVWSRPAAQPTKPELDPELR